MIRPVEAEAPNRAYYRSVAGRWSGELHLAITDWGAFRRSPLSALDRGRVLSMLLAARVLGPFRLETSVDASGADRGEIVHTTRVAKWGLTLMRSVERIALSANGRDAAMRIEMRFAPTLWKRRIEPDTPVTIDATGHRASYRFTWFGAPMRQEAERSADGEIVTLVQTTSFARGDQRLRRRRDPKP
jgi:hypothetical protein